jgi:phosphomannomutase
VTHRFHSSILREYDFRGVVGETLFEADALALGQAFGTFVTVQGGTSICVGYDGRLSSPALEAALVEGLKSTGLEVRRIGCGPTPMLHFAEQHTDASAGIMVTGSHNPANHNGFKLTVGKHSLFPEEMAELVRMAAEDDIETPNSGRITELTILDDYVARIAQDYRPGHDLTVVWDAGNGAAGEAMATLAQRLPGRHILLNETIDGHFPAHHADPSDPQNMEQLIAAVAQEQADLGLAFDADGDRLGVVDSKGRILWGDHVLLLLAEDLLATHPGALILADVKSSQALFDRIATAGGRSEMCRTGNTFIKARMMESGALLAGEMSGHLFFADRYYGYDDGLYAAMRLLSRIATWGDHNLAQWIDGLPRLIGTPELRIPCPGERRYQLVEELAQRLLLQGVDMTIIDGVRVKTSDGWWLLRPSNTLDVLVARCEATSPAGLNRLYAALRAELAIGGIEIPG